MIKRTKKKEKIDFLLQNKHYQRLHLILYLLSILVVVIVYFVTIILFSSYSPNYIITGIFSVLVGIYLIFYRDRLVHIISDKLEDYKRKKIKKDNKDGLKTTLKKIAPKKNRIKLQIKPNEPIKEKIKKLKSKITSKKPQENNKTKKVDYIEIK